jgi:hypothetical protein
MTGVILILLGVAAAAAGYVRFRAPWAKYQALKAQEENIARYESWRGGLRDTGTTGASVAIDMLRGQVRQAGAIMGAGAVLVIAGLLVK